MSKELMVCATTGSRRERTLTFSPRRYLHLSAAMCGALMLVAFTACAAASTGLPRLLADGPHWRYRWEIRPAHIVYTGDGSGVLGGFDGTNAAHPGHLTWTSWTQQRAQATGAVWIDDCSPDCANGTFTAHAVRVVAFRPLNGRFTRVTLTYRYHGKRDVDRRGISREGGSWSYYIVR